MSTPFLFHQVDHAINIGILMEFQSKGKRNIFNKDSEKEKKNLYKTIKKREREVLLTNSVFTNFKRTALTFTRNMIQANIYTPKMN